MDASSNSARRRAGFMIGTGVVVLASSLGVALFGGRSYHSPADGAQTRVESDVAITTHNVPPIFGGTDLTARYDLPVRNWWDEPLYIDDVIPTCDCSKAELASRNLLPKGETTLHVEVALPAIGGRRGVSCMLEARSGKRLVHRFTVVGYPYVQLDNEDGVISFGEVTPGQEVRTSQTVFLHAPKKAGVPPEVVSVKAESPDVTAWIEPTSTVEELPGGHGLRAVTALHVCLRPGDFAGVGATDLVMEYRGQGFSGTLPILVMWNVKPLFSFDPPRLFITVRDAQSAPLVRSVRLMSRENRSFRLLSIKAAVPWIRVLKIPSEISPVNEISIEIRPASGGTQAFTELEVTTDHPLQPVMRLPVSLLRAANTDRENLTE